MDRVTGLTLFTRVVEAGSFSAAAREASLSQPTVSKAIAALEAQLGARLLSRTTRRLSVTHAGIAFYARAKRILADLDEAEASAGGLHGVPRGTLRVGAPVAFGRLHIMPTIPDFLRRYPGLGVDLSMRDRFTDLAEERVDVAIRVGKLSDMSLVARHLGHSPWVTVATPAYLAARGEPETLADLARHDCIVYTSFTTGDEWRFARPSGPAAVRVKGTFRTDSSEAIRAAVLAGLGIAVVPAWLVPEALASGELRTVLPGYVPTAMDVSALYAPTPHVAAKVRVFIDHLVDAFRRSNSCVQRIAHAPGGGQWPR